MEGPTNDPAVLDLRDRMRRNIAATMLLSQGTPMILMGDEVGRTQQGNNNAYCQDNEITWFNWKNIGERDRAFMEFLRGVIRIRKRYRILRANRFLHGEPVDEKGTRSVVWFRPDGQEMDARQLERHQRQGRGPHAFGRRHPAAHPDQRLPPADAVHAADGGRVRLDVRIDAGTGEIDPPDRRFAPGSQIELGGRSLLLLAGEIGGPCRRRGRRSLLLLRKSEFAGQGKPISRGGEIRRPRIPAGFSVRYAR